VLEFELERVYHITKMTVAIARPVKHLNSFRFIVAPHSSKHHNFLISLFAFSVSRALLRLVCAEHRSSTAFFLIFSYDQGVSN